VQDNELLILGENIEYSFLNINEAEKLNTILIDEKRTLQCACPNWHRIIRYGVRDDSQLEKIRIRSVQTCNCVSGICAKCYGADMASRKTVLKNTAVGIMAAQSIGEPGTQLTMRTFHTGGVAGDDITQGLPRVEELLEARRPKKVALFAKQSGVVKEIDDKKIILADNSGCESTLPLYIGMHPLVKTGDIINTGDVLTDGSLDLKDYISYAGQSKTWDYILKEIQKVYRLQGVEIADKHIEIIIKKMLSQCKVLCSDNSTYFQGNVVSLQDLEENSKLPEDDRSTVEYETIILGITAVSLLSNSFIAAASFQETQNVLAKAAIAGKTDNLRGIKENVVLGNRIPSPLYK